MNYLYLFSFLSVVIVLIINSIEDIKTRKVPFKNQILLLIASFPMNYYNPSWGLYQIAYLILIYGLFKFGMGGADARTLAILGGIFTYQHLIWFLSTFIILSFVTMIFMKSQKVPGIPAISLAFFIMFMIKYIYV